MEIKRLTATERETLMRLNLAQSFLTEDAQAVHTRAGMFPRGRWYLGVARGMLSRFMDAVFSTVPTEQLVALRRSLMETTFTVGVKCTATMNNDAARMKNYGVVVPIGALNALFAACSEHCLVCMGNTEEQKRCELRKALDAIPNDVEDDGGAGCPYQNVLISSGKEEGV